MMTDSQKYTILSEGFVHGVAATCKKYAISRTLYYRWLKKYHALGIDGLSAGRTHFVPSNKTPSNIEDALLRLIPHYPHYGPRTLGYLLQEQGHKLSESAVFNILKRHGLTHKSNRIHFAKQKMAPSLGLLPPTTTLTSGVCWLFWLTDLGTYPKLGQLYLYTFLDVKSHIACTRLYTEATLACFEDLLTAVAIPIAKSLCFKPLYLCVMPHLTLDTLHQEDLHTKLKQTLSLQNIDVTLCVMPHQPHRIELEGLQTTYTKNCLHHLLPAIQQGEKLHVLKTRLQIYLRDYNLNRPIMHIDSMLSPVTYHNQLTHTKPILPIWAYMNRHY